MSMYNSLDVGNYKTHVLIQREITQRRLQNYIRKQGYNPADPKIINMQTKIVRLAEELELATKLQREMEMYDD